MNTLQTAFIKVAQSGATIDGRELKPQWLLDMAETYSPETYTALIWPEHMRWQGNFGEVTAVRAETNADGVVSLFAQLTPNERYLAVNGQRQKRFFSVEVLEDFARTGKTYLGGLGITDSPASLGSGKMHFCVDGATFAVFPGLPLESVHSDTNEETSERGLLNLIKEFFTKHDSKLALPEPLIDKANTSMDKQQFDALMGKMEELAAKVEGFAVPAPSPAETPQAATTTPPAADTDTLFAALGAKLDTLSNSFASLSARLEAAQPGTVVPETTGAASGNGLV